MKPADLIMEERSKRLDIQGQIPAKALFIHFYLTNDQWLADFSKYCTFHLLLLT